MIVVSCLIILAFAKYAYSDRFLNFIGVLQNEKYLSSNLRKTSHWHPFNMLITLVQTCSISLVAFLLYAHISGKNPADEPFVFLQLLLGYILLMVAKGFLEYLTTLVLGLKSAFATYLFKKVSYRNFLGIVMLFCACLLVYTPIQSNILILITLSLAGIIALISVVNIISNYRSEILIHPFYFILYFCALEIAPYYILYKVIEL